MSLIEITCAVFVILIGGVVLYLRNIIDSKNVLLAKYLEEGLQVQAEHNELAYQRIALNKQLTECGFALNEKTNLLKTATDALQEAIRGEEAARALYNTITEHLNAALADANLLRDTLVNVEAELDDLENEHDLTLLELLKATQPVPKKRGRPVKKGK